MNGKYRLPPLTRKPVAWSERVSLALMKLAAWPHFAKVASVLLLLVLAGSLLGCATTSAPPSTMPRNPEPPPSRLPDSPPTYLDDAKRDISEWRRLLQELIAKPAN